MKRNFGRLTALALCLCLLLGVAGAADYSQSILAGELTLSGSVTLQSGVLAPVCGTKFTRIRAMLHLDGCVCELAGDIGELSRGTRRAPLCELELELKDGEAAPMLAYGRALAEKFGLREEHSSKSERARRLEQV